MKYSRKKLFASTFGFVVICLISSCAVVSSGGSGVPGKPDPTSKPNWTGESITWDYKEDWVQKELPAGTGTVNITADTAVDVFFAKMNMGDTVIPADNTRYLVSSGFISTESRSATGLSLESSSQNILSRAANLEDVSGITGSGIVRMDYAPARDFVPPKITGFNRGASSRSAGVDDEDDSDVYFQPLETTTQIAGTVNVDTKELWVDVPASVGSDMLETSGEYTKRPATLRAKGDRCYVWVLDAYYDSSGGGSQIDSDQAQILADKFDELYPLIRGVFGYESNKMVDIHYSDENGNGQYDEGEPLQQGYSPVSGENEASVPGVCDTGDMVNIVVYDIGGDYSPTQTGGTMGYFWAKDYYTNAIAPYTKSDVIKLTNNGKYFYVDSWFFNLSPETMYSTLAHEFQHMIHFGVKTLFWMESEMNLKSESWFDEMMSMVCEDMVQDYLDLDDSQSPISRLPTFCSNYYLSGLTDWHEGDSVLLSYAGAYAFGAYLARNYGGTSLFSKIAENMFANQESITAALEESLTHSEETFYTVFEKYLQALLIDNPPSGNVPTFNKSVDGIGTNAEGSPTQMKAIDIFNLDVPVQGGFVKETRPVFLKKDADYRVDLRPYGFTLHYVGNTPSAGVIQLDFSSPVDENEKIFILVQPHKD